MRNIVCLLGMSACCLSLATSAVAQGDSVDSDAPLIDAMKYRCIGPFRGGRAGSVAGVAGKPMLGYFGATGGGVWKTEDGGSSWANISDGFFGGSIGAVAVSESDPNTIYVGGGEVTVRGNVSSGNGMWKSINGGKTWDHIGLEDSKHIPRIRIHPTNPDVVFVAALGHLYGPNQQRGIFKSVDGGKTWNRVLFVNDEAGAVDIVFDPNNTRVLYASTWKVLRTPYSLESGGEGSGIWKSTDAGETWKEITRNNGLPKGTIGISGVAVSPVDSNRVWAIVEAKDGGLFRSDNAGESWRRINQDRNLRQRAWYYTRIYAGPDNIDEVYVLNVSFWRSNDGGANFSSIRTPHGDHHDLWIDPQDSKRMLIADDGGGQVTYNGGQTWSTYENQPTAQFYRVTTDDHFPYRIYGAQQDNSTVRIASRTSGFSIGERDWEPTAGGESGHIAPDPADNDIVYGGSYGGYLTRMNHRTGERRNVHIWPDNPMGHGAIDLKYRFQWNFPIFFSPNDKKTLYAAANVLFKTTDGGASWTQISKDLTRNDKSKLGPSGGPITKDNTSVEYYCTIFAAAESHLEPGLLWAGSDDGLIHVSKDGGKEWKNVTPPNLPEWAQINSIEVHPTKKGGLYVAATRYKLDDFRPYLYRTLDYGETWTKITNGIGRSHFTRVVRADPQRDGLLYAGTEEGMYVSFDDGANWKSFQCNLPTVPVTDLALKNNDLIVATQGRAFWVMDDLSLLHQWADAKDKDTHLFKTNPVYRMRGRGSSRLGRTSGQNVLGGVPIRFMMASTLKNDQQATLEIQEADGTAVQTYATKPEDGQSKLSVQEGINEVRWNMTYKGAESFPGMVLWGGGTGGPTAVPGQFKAVLKVGESEQAIDFEIKKDPRATATIADLQAQHDFIAETRDKLSETHKGIKQLRDVRTQISELKARLKKQGDDQKDLVKQADAITKKLTKIEEALYQTQNQSGQDPLNFPIRLNNRLSGVISVASTGDNAPTAQAIAVRDEIAGLIDIQLKQLSEVMDKELPAFNKAVRDSQVPAIFPPAP
ncbi:MAG: glycosyl hydrolase [Planctomycetaceae bacterium]